MTDPEQSVLRLVRGAWVTMALRGACLLGVFDELVEPVSVDDLAARTASDPATLARLVRVLVDLGLVEETGSAGYRNTALGVTMSEDHPSRMRDVLLMQASLPNLGAWGAIEDAVRRGRGVFEQVNGSLPWELLARDPASQTRFNASMARRGAGQAAVLLAATDLSDASMLVDVGGGRGAMVARLLAELPTLRARVADQPAMAAEADDFFAAEGLGERAAGAPCDFFDSVPEGGDVYTIANVIHDWDDADSVAILSTVREAMPAHARLLVVEHVLDAPGRSADQQRDVHLLDLHMLVMFGARERTQAEYDELLVAAGFTRSELANTGTDWNVLEARPVP